MPLSVCLPGQGGLSQSDERKKTQDRKEKGFPVGRGFFFFLVSFFGVKRAYLKNPLLVTSATAKAEIWGTLVDTPCPPPLFVCLVTASVCPTFFSLKTTRACGAVGLVGVSLPSQSGTATRVL